MIQLTATTIRTLKGCPLSIVVALMLNQAPTSAQWLERTTGYSDKVVLSALQFLDENHFVTRNGRYGWQLAGSVMQLPIAIPLIEEPEPGGTRNFSDSEKFRLGEIPGPLESRSSLDPDLEKELDKNLASSGNDPEKFRVEKILAECDRSGIHEPARSQIARLGHVSPEYIQYHVRSSQSVGQAIYRIKNGWKAKSVSMETVEAVAVDDQEEETVEAVAVDELAESWWADLVDKLRELLPRAIFSTWVQPDKLARRVGEVLFVLASNEMVGAEIARHVPQNALNDLVKAISAGKVIRICFVITFPKGA